MPWIPTSRLRWGHPRTESKGLASEGEGIATLLMVPLRLHACPGFVPLPREKGWSSECVGLWDPSQMEQQIGASHLQTVTFGWGSHILCEVEAVLCKTLTKSYFKCKMERNINIALFARARARARTHTHTHTHTQAPVRRRKFKCQAFSKRQASTILSYSIAATRWRHANHKQVASVRSLGVLKCESF